MERFGFGPMHLKRIVLIRYCSGLVPKERFVHERPIINRHSILPFTTINIQKIRRIVASDGNYDDDDDGGCRSRDYDDCDDNDDIVNNFNKRIKSVPALLDVEKAFDKVWHDGLNFKLSALNLPIQLINIIKSFLSNRSFYIKVDKQFSTVKPIQAGVPQGSCLSPHLFSLYINDMPKHTNCNTALFADDTLFLAQCRSNNSAVRKLQQQLDLSQLWFDE
jgi:hypothetical protein